MVNDEHGENIEETTKMLTQNIDKDESIPLSSKSNVTSDETTPSHSELETAINHTAATSTATTSDWYLEGVRRVRYDHVQRKMRYLTGTAAIGGFLFGYDTGKTMSKSYFIEICEEHITSKNVLYICDMDMFYLHIGFLKLSNNRRD